MEIDYINGPKTEEIFGVSKYQNEIHKRLDDIYLNTIEYDVFEFVIKNIDLGNVFKSYLAYPLIVKKNIKKDNIKHVTSQSFAYLLTLNRLKNSIVTCYDLIPWVYDNNRSIPWKLNIMGLKRADEIITISNFSKNDIIRILGFPEEKIHIVNPGVDHKIYFQNNNKEILSSLNIKSNQKIILYVGSEQPRQNFDSLLKSFAQLKDKISNIKLLKIGKTQAYGARKKHLELIKELKIRNDVIFMDYIPEKELPQWYNCADLVVYPCSYAGFGLPPLEAMACGIPVITSNESSLPEVVGDAGIMINPKDLKKMTIKMFNVLTDNSIRDEMIKKGLKRVKKFDWNDSAKKTNKIYEEFNLY
ncbi:MAG: mannosyltransferase [Methanobacterium sp. BRmetb2]|nr:MAG: mannosyltransferase [Methanobacterium sp. BRmetb2]